MVNFSAPLPVLSVILHVRLTAPLLKVLLQLFAMTNDSNPFLPPASIHFTGTGKLEVFLFLTLFLSISFQVTRQSSASRITLFGARCFFDEHCRTIGYHVFGGLIENQGPTRTIIMDISLNLWKKWTREYHSRLHIQKRRKKNTLFQNQQQPLRTLLYTKSFFVLQSYSYGLEDSTMKLFID